MTKPQPTSTTQTEAKSIARRKAYLSYIEKYPLYSTLLVLNDYENEEKYEECAIIRDAVAAYREKYASRFPKDLLFPISVSQYKNKAFQDTMQKLDLLVEEKTARDKATLIKLNLPITE